MDGAIHCGGSQIIDECRRIRAEQFSQGLPTGEAVVTGGGNPSAKFVIHTVGPVYGMNGGRDSALLAAGNKNCLALAVEKNLLTIAFPSISTGAFGYPKHEAAEVSPAAV